MKKIFLILLLCLFSSSVSAGFKEIGSSYVSQETKDKINIQYLADSIFLTPTSENPWDPYEVFCKKNVREFTHEKFMAPGGSMDRCKNQRLIDSM